MKKTLITGGAGFIGSHLIESLLAHGGYEITCIDNFDTFYNPLIKRKNIVGFQKNPLFQLIDGDICADETYNKIKDKNFDTIVHLAAKAGVRPSILDPVACEQVNVLGTLKLLEFAKNKSIKQFVFASSSSVYGVNPRVPWSEGDYVLNPISPYAGTKIACELLGHTYSYLYNIRFVGLRFFTVYGPKQRPDLAIHKFFNLIHQEKPIPFFGDGSTKRDYTFVDDIVKGVHAAMLYDRSFYEIINLGNRQTVTLAELVAAIEQTMGKKAILEKLPQQAGDVPQTYADISKAQQLLGYNPTTNIETGLKKFSEWFNKQH